jgi:hypothetical protein
MSHSSSSSSLVPVSEHDYLEQDPEIRGQKYACMSVINPHDVIKRKDAWFFQEFMAGIAAEMQSLWANTIEINKEAQPEFVDSLRKIQDRYDYVFDATKIHEAYEFFRSANQQRLEGEYLEKNNFQTSIAGIKIRGSYDTLREAQIRAEVLKRKDPHFNVYIGEVGCWLPLDPDPSQIDNQEFAETQLNTLVKGYKENQAQKDAYYESRKEILCDQANEINEIRKKKNQEELATELAAAQDPWMARRIEGGEASVVSEIEPVAEEVPETDEAAVVPEADDATTSATTTSTSTSTKRRASTKAPKTPRAAPAPAARARKPRGGPAPNDAVA